MKRRSAKNPQKDILDTATRMGELLLESGAEIARVEESMERVCHYYGAEGESFYVLSNGIFLTAEDAAGNCYAPLKMPPLSAISFSRSLSFSMRSVRRVNRLLISFMFAMTSRLSSLAPAFMLSIWLEMLSSPA